MTYDEWRTASPDDYHEPPDPDDEPTEEELEEARRKLAERQQKGGKTMANDGPTAFEIHDTRLNGRDAAERFAAECRREIRWLGGSDFQFVDGVKTYRLNMTSTGWRILEIEPCPTP